MNNAPAPLDTAGGMTGKGLRWTARASEERGARGGRPATGSIVWADPETKTKPIGVRVTKANGKRRSSASTRARRPTTRDALAPILAERARFAVGERERRDGRGVREAVVRVARGRGARMRRRGSRAPARHVAPDHRARCEIADVTRDDLKRLVDALDVKAAPGFTRTPTAGASPSDGRRAVNVVGHVVRALFRDASGAKRVDLCVRDDNPAAGVAGPDTGQEGEDVPLAE